MAKIDRSGNEKVINIGPWKLKLSTFCALGLVFIMVGSSLGYVASELGKPKQPKPQNSDIKQAGLIIFFDENNTVEKTANIDIGQSALGLFKKIATITTIDGPNGKIVTSVAYKNFSAENTEVNQWAFYVNARLNLGGVDKYAPSNGDQIMLKYERKLF